MFRSKRVSDSYSDTQPCGIKLVGLSPLVLAFTMGVATADAQQPAKVFKIGWLGTRPSSGGTSTDRGSDITRRMLRELNYVEGKNIIFEFRSADNKLERLPALADELIHLNVDLIFVSDPNGALAAKNVTRTIPIVFLLPVDPVVAGLVDSLPRPGGNLTGFTNIAGVLSGKRLELLKETLPKLSRVAVLWNPQGATAQQWQESQLAARDLKLQLHSMEVSSADKFESAFKGAAKARSAALAVTQNPLANSHQQRIAQLAVKFHLPAIGGRADFVESGGLMSYGPDQIEPYKRIASMIDKILKGTKPADIPVEQPTKFELAINLKTAKALA